MIKAKEYRIGNWVSNGEVDYQITAATIMHLTVRPNDAIVLPIPITPEWLERFGFECVYKSAMHSTYFNNCMSYYFWNKPWNKPNQQYAEFNAAIIHCKYIHQIQNLYFALTGEELILKP